MPRTSSARSQKSSGNPKPTSATRIKSAPATIVRDNGNVESAHPNPHLIPRTLKGLRMTAAQLFALWEHGGPNDGPNAEGVRVLGYVLYDDGESQIVIVDRSFEYGGGNLHGYVFIIRGDEARLVGDVPNLGGFRSWQVVDGEGDFATVWEPRWTVKTRVPGLGVAVVS